MKEPIVLGLGAEVPDEVLETRAAQIRARAEAFTKALTALSVEHNVWLDGDEEQPILVDGATDERAGNAEWDSSKQAYTTSFYYYTLEPTEYRREWIAREEERLKRHEQWDRERAERLQKQAEEEQRMRAAGYERLEYRHTPGMGMQYTHGGTIYAVGTAGAWINPQTGHVYTGGTPDPKEYRP